MAVMLLVLTTSISSTHNSAPHHHAHHPNAHPTLPVETLRVPTSEQFRTLRWKPFFGTGRTVKRATCPLLLLIPSSTLSSRLQVLLLLEPGTITISPILPAPYMACVILMRNLLPFITPLLAGQEVNTNLFSPLLPKVRVPRLPLQPEGWKPPTVRDPPLRTSIIRALRLFLSRFLLRVTYIVYRVTLVGRTCWPTTCLKPIARLKVIPLTQLVLVTTIPLSYPTPPALKAPTGVKTK